MTFSQQKYSESLINLPFVPKVMQKFLLFKFNILKIHPQVEWFLIKRKKSHHQNSKPFMIVFYSPHQEVHQPCSSHRWAVRSDTLKPCPRTRDTSRPGLRHRSSPSFLTEGLRRTHGHTQRSLFQCAFPKARSHPSRWSAGEGTEWDLCNSGFPSEGLISGD